MKKKKNACMNIVIFNLLMTIKRDNIGQHIKSMNIDCYVAINLHVVFIVIISDSMKDS